MGVQLLFAVETNKKCDSDWIYIKNTIEQFYTCLLYTSDAADDAMNV